MIDRLKPGKISIVVFLTFLIWVWADLAMDEPLILSDIRIEVAKSTDQSLWVNFVVEGADPNLRTSVALDEVVLKGPASRIAEVSRRKNRGDLDLNLFLVPEREGLTQAEVHSLNVLDFLRKNDEISKLGLTVESCEPQRLTLVTYKLEEQDVTVECVGIDASLQVTLDPSSVTAYVPAGKTFRARIQLSPAEQNQAKTGPIEKTPYVELVPGQRRDVATKVEVALAPAQNVLLEYVVPATYGICFSPNLQGKYKVIVHNEATELANVYIRATTPAYMAYRDAPYKLILDIEDTDRQITQWPILRPFKFRFPEEYVRRGEIEARDDRAPIAQFTLVPIAAETEIESGP
ncbi:MAG: hypothetical protein ABFD90_05640 [Phycisphaerales bacterium]